MQNSSDTDIDHLKSDRTILGTSNVCISLLSIAIAIMDDINSGLCPEHSDFKCWAPEQYTNKKNYSTLTQQL